MGSHRPRPPGLRHPHLLLHTGRITFWGYPGDPGTLQNRTLPRTPGWGPLTNGLRYHAAEIWQWDISKPLPPETSAAEAGTFTREFGPPTRVDADADGDVETVPAPLFCSGASFLPDGRLLVAGGNLAFPRDDKGGKAMTAAGRASTASTSTTPRPGSGAGRSATS